MLQIKGTGDLGLDLRLQISFVDPTHVDRQGAVRLNHLPRTVRLYLHTGAQAFVTGHQGVETALQGRDIQRTFEAQGAGDMVRRAVRVQLPEEPLAFLGVRQRQRLFATDRDKWRCLLTFRRFQGLQGAGKTFEPGLLEDQLQRDFTAQYMAQARDHLHGQ
ncbi:hypothetical protein [Pseudomonas sp. 24 E 1]|nr:hypothetical protein [Pseudomonas sp. 24 E 1]